MDIIVMPTAAEAELLTARIIADAINAKPFYKLGLATGRTVIRYSGTENKVRILVEAKDEALAQKWYDKFADFLKKALC